MEFSEIYLNCQVLDLFYRPFKAENYGCQWPMLCVNHNVVQVIESLCLTTIYCLLSLFKFYYFILFIFFF